MSSTWSDALHEPSTQPVPEQPAVTPADSGAASPAAYFLTQTPAPLMLEFRGSAAEYFRIWIVNLCLTLLTLGLFSAWAKVRKKRYFYANTVLEGTPFRYLGRPLPILKGRIVAVALSIVYWLASQFFPSLLPGLVLVTLIVAPWIVSRSLAFNARYSEYRGEPFRFDAGYVATAKALYSALIIPVLLLGTVVLGPKIPGLAAALTGLAGFFLPVWIARMKRFTAAHLSFAGQEAECGLRGRLMWNIYFGGGLLLIPAVAASLGVGFVASRLAGNDPAVIAVSSAAGIALGYLLMFAYVRARSQNAAWNETTLGPLCFRMDLKARRVAWLYLTNALAILSTLGLATPWAVIRMLRYRVAHMQIAADGDLSVFRRSGAAAGVDATGAETTEMFDLDLSL